MSIYPIVTEQEMIELGKLAEQQKNQRANKVENIILKQTHYEKSAKASSP